MMSVTIIATVNVTMNAMITWNPINKNVTAKIEAVEKIFYLIEFVQFKQFIRDKQLYNSTIMFDMTLMLF